MIITQVMEFTQEPFEPFECMVSYFAATRAGPGHGKRPTADAALNATGGFVPYELSPAFDEMKESPNEVVMRSEPIDEQFSMVRKTWPAQGRENMQKGKLILGIDEAGRGCAIGPMVVGGVTLEEHIAPKLKAEGVRDSKAVTPAMREELAEKIRSLAAGVFIEEIPPSEIEERNLNLLEIQRIRRIISEANADVVYLDAPVAGQKGIDAFCQHIKRRLPGDCPKIVAENRADATYVSVAAASIIAKVRRDAIVADLRRQLGDFGSGYPSDEKTQKFLRDHFEKEGCFPDCVRRRWLTVRRLTEPTQSFLPFADDG